MNDAVNTTGSLVYEYIRYNNRLNSHLQEYVDYLISEFISQDTNKEYAFVVTYVGGVPFADAEICVFYPADNELQSLGCIMASARGMLSTFQPCISTTSSSGDDPTPSDVERYFAEGYVAEGYVENH